MLFSQILLDVMVDKHNKHVPLHLYIKMMDDARNINHPAEPSQTLTTQKRLELNFNLLQRFNKKINYQFQILDKL
jgi:hypothetical protein